MQLDEIVTDFARSIERVDARSPQAVNARSKKPFQPGIGPHSESETVEMVTSDMAEKPKYSGLIETAVPYPDASRQKCDFCIGKGREWEWAVEVKMLRMLGDNGKPNDNILMHILSPYPEHRSAVTDCEKLSSSGLGRRNAILIYGYEAEEFPLIKAIDAFEIVAANRARLGERKFASFGGLIHPVHASGQVFAWELEPGDASPNNSLERTGDAGE
jgi:hypothetical protein